MFRPNVTRDLLIPLRDGPNEELRYVLRSFHVNHPPHRVITAGGRPDWLTNTGHLPIDQAPNQPRRNTIRNLRALLEAAGSDEVIIACDDTYVIDPLEEMPRLHRGPIAENIPRDKVGARQVASTLQILDAHGVTDPLLYELHVPAVYDRRRLVDTLDLIETHMYARPPHRVAEVLWATVYGNLHGVGGQRADNVKVYTLEPVVVGPTPFVSTNDTTFRDGVIGEQLRVLFPDPSPYER